MTFIYFFCLFYLPSPWRIQRQIVILLSNSWNERERRIIHFSPLRQLWVWRVVMETVGGGVAIAPPRLAPVSGVLSQVQQQQFLIVFLFNFFELNRPITFIILQLSNEQGQGVIKPIACRPVVSSANTTPILGNRCLNSQPTTSPANNNNNNNTNNSNNSNAGRHSWGLYNSTSDLRSTSLSTPAGQTPSSGSGGGGSGGSRGPPIHMQRFSWSKSHAESSDMGTLSGRPAAPGQRQPPSKLDTLPTLSSHLSPVQQSTTPASKTASVANINSVNSQGRVADLSRRFGGSLSSVAAPPNSPTHPRQPPAYRPPPSSSRASSKYSCFFLNYFLNFNGFIATPVIWPSSVQKKNNKNFKNFSYLYLVNKGTSSGNNGGGIVSYSSSELHLDRVSSNSMPFSCARTAPNATSTPQWVLGGSEVNLSSLTRWI